MEGQAELTASSHILGSEPWEARCAIVAAISIGTFCIHTDISAQITFIDVCKKGWTKLISLNLIFEVAEL